MKSYSLPSAVSLRQSSDLTLYVHHMIKRMNIGGDGCILLHKEAIGRCEEEGSKASPYLIKLLDLYLSYYQDEKQKASEKASDLLIELEGSPFNRIRGMCFDFLSLVNRDWGTYKEALQHLHQGLRCFEGDSDDQIVCSLLNNIGVIYQRQGNFQKAIKYLFRGLNIAKSIGSGDLSLLNNLALCYKNVGMFDKAKEVFTTLVERRIEEDNPHGLVLALMNLAIVHGETNELESCKLNLHKALDVAERKGVIRTLQSLYINLAHLSQLEGELDLAYEFALKGIEAGKKYASLRLELENLSVLGGVALEMGRVDEALTAYLKAETLGGELGEDPRLIGVMEQIASIFAEQQNFEKAYGYRQKQMELQAEVKRQSKVTDIVAQETKELEKALEQMTEKARYQALLLEKSKKIERQNEELRQFAYATAHDISEPLRMISSFTDLLVRQVSENLDPKGKEYADFIKKGTTRLNLLLSDLLKFTGLEHDEFDLGVVNIDRIILDLKTVWKEEIQAANAQIIAPNLPSVSGVEQHVFILFQNLISNALRFRDPSKDCKIEVGHNPGEKFHQFYVKDNGIGVLKEDQEKIFSLFRKLSDSGPESTGLGLAICRKIVQNLDGDIWIESKVGEGSTFYFTLPRSDA